MKPNGRALLDSLLGLGILVALSLAGDLLARLSRLPLPGNVVGLLLLLLLLAVGVVKLSWIERAADLLLGHLSLFFVPAAVAVIGRRDVLAPALVALLAVVVIVVVSTLVVMAVTGHVAQSLLPRAPSSDPSPSSNHTSNPDQARR